MVYFVVTFIVLACVSFVWAAASLVINRFRFSTGSKRAAFMLVVWLGFAVLLHVLMQNSDEFRQGLPASILNLDVQHEFYGRDAIRELTRRAREGSTGREDWEVTTNTLIDHPWWTNDTDGLIPGPTGAPMHPGELWFAHLLTIESLPAEQFYSWLRIDPPPIFSAPDRVELGGSSLAAAARYGREWVAEHNLAYEVTQIAVDAVRLNGEAVEFELSQAPDSQADLGRYAHKVLWFIQGLPQPDAAGQVVLEIDYRIWAEPGRFADIGPLTWSKSIRVE